MCASLAHSLQGVCGWRDSLGCSACKWHILSGVLWGLISPRIAAQREICPLLTSCVPLSNSLRAKACSVLSCSDWNCPTFPYLWLFNSYLFFFSLSLNLDSFHTYLKILSFSTHPFFSMSHLSLFYLVYSLLTNPSSSKLWNILQIGFVFFFPLCCQSFLSFLHLLCITWWGKRGVCVCVCWCFFQNCYEVVF